MTKHFKSPPNKLPRNLLRRIAKHGHSKNLKTKLKTQSQTTKLRPSFGPLKSIVIAAALLMLQACSMTSNTLPVIYDTNLTQDCDRLPTLPQQWVMGDLVVLSKAERQLYVDCAQRHHEMVAAAKQS